MNSIEQRPLTPWATKSGVIVGGAYIKPQKQMSADAERVQAALLLPKPKPSLVAVLMAYLVRKQ
jgi:hypothetical protein